MDIYITESDIFGEYLYRVMVDGQVYDKFFSKSGLTLGMKIDVVNGYREGLENYERNG